MRQKPERCLMTLTLRQRACMFQLFPIFFWQLPFALLEHSGNLHICRIGFALQIPHLFAALLQAQSQLRDGLIFLLQCLAGFFYFNFHWGGKATLFWQNQTSLGHVWQGLPIGLGAHLFSQLLWSLHGRFCDRHGPFGT